MKAPINGIHIYFEDQGQGTPVVLIHGFPLDHTIWDAVTSILKEHARVLTPDLRGWGRSDAPQGVYSMSLMASDVRALLDHLGIERAILVGHSMGGYVSLAFARAYPGRISALGLVASHAAPDTEERKAGRYAEAAEVLQKGVQVVANSMAPRLTRDAALAGSVRALILTASAVGVAGSLKGMAERDDSRPSLPGLPFPAIVIAGGADGLIPIERSREMLDLLPNATYVEAPGAGHLPMMEQPGLVAGAVLQLVAKVEGESQ